MIEALTLTSSHVPVTARAAAPAGARVGALAGGLRLRAHPPIPPRGRGRSGGPRPLRLRKRASAGAVAVHRYFQQSAAADGEGNSRGLGFCLLRTENGAQNAPRANVGQSLAEVAPWYAPARRLATRGDCGGQGGVCGGDSQVTEEPEMAEHFCGRCGVARTTNPGWCSECMVRHQYHDLANWPCGVCGRPSDWWSIRGFRCSQHHGVADHRTIVIDMPGLVGAVCPGPAFRSLEEIRQSGGL